MKKRVLLIVLAMVLVAALSVGLTLAYLTSHDEVVNTFTVGKVEITLDEAAVDEYGVPVAGEDRVQGNEYKLIPGHTYVKDPTVTVLKDSEASYVRMKVKVEWLDKLKANLTDSKYYSDGIFLLQNLCVDENGVNTWNNEKWNYASFDAASNTYIFNYHTTVSTVDATNNQSLEPLFTKITLPSEIVDDVNGDVYEGLADVKIIITAEAIQADGFDNANEAWAAFDVQND